MKYLLSFCLLILPQILLAEDQYLSIVKRLLQNDPEYIEVQNQKNYQESLYKASLSQFALPSVDLSLSKVDHQKPEKCLQARSCCCNAHERRFGFKANLFEG